MNPVELEIARAAFAFIPEEMGVALRRTAYSPNIKERADASCALFDDEGRMVAQAEHIPVHLGSMPVAIEVLREEYAGTLREADQVILNDPYHGGTHLPDITLIRPVFVRGGLVGYTANRAHHADVGGIAPGSMPAGATRLDEEGVVLEPQKFLDRGRERREVLDLVRKTMRNPTERIGDLRAQVAANELGARRLRELAERHGVTRLHADAGELLDYSERRVRAAIQGLPRGAWKAEDFLEGVHPDDPERIRIAAEVTVGGSGITVEFAGSARQVHGNLNAPPAVTTSAVYYALRCLTDPDAPANGGAYRPIRVRAEDGTVVRPRAPAAVAAGNVETSQRIVDVVFLALAEPLADLVPAQSQGTMNNVTIGSARGGGWSYYETVAGGEGAFPYRDGMDGVHTHMTNTRNTPVEALELAYPLRVEEYRLRPSTGGAGTHRGGDGVRRAVRLLKGSAVASVISERRALAPAGLSGGEPGGRGRNRLVRGGKARNLPAKVTLDLRAGDVLVIESPGGGGWGPPRRP
ncbi:MAG: hydantoinase B/oxoprolinase family protein [Methanobacteriota archaeon]